MQIQIKEIHPLSSLQDFNYVYFISFSCSGRYFRLLDIQHVRISDIFCFTQKVIRYPFLQKEIFLPYQKTPQTLAFRRGFKGINAGT